MERRPDYGFLPRMIEKCIRATKTAPSLTAIISLPTYARRTL